MIYTIRNYWNTHKETQRFIKFAIVGTIGMLVDLGILNILIFFFLGDVSNEGFTQHQQTLVGIFQAISFTAAVINNFILNTFWTYPETRGDNVTKRLAQFFLVSVLGFAIRTVIVMVGLEPMRVVLLGLLTALRVPEVEGLDGALAPTGITAVAILVVMMWNFFINRRLTFADVD
jgi:putative flippase GtrA